MTAIVSVMLCGFTTQTTIAHAPVYDYKSTTSEEARMLAKKIAKLRDKYYLEYKSEEDLLETAQIIVAHQTKTFDKYDIAAIVVKESRFNHLALNRRDGSKGLMQVLKVYWKKELPWYTNPYDKGQSIKAGVEVLKLMHMEHKTKYAAIKHYNGSTAKSDAYRTAVLKIKKDIQTA